MRPSLKISILQFLLQLYRFHYSNHQINWSNQLNRIVKSFDFEPNHHFIDSIVSSNQLNHVIESFDFKLNHQITKSFEFKKIKMIYQKFSQKEEDNWRFTKKKKKIKMIYRKFSQKRRRWSKILSEDEGIINSIASPNQLNHITESFDFKLNHQIKSSAQLYRQINGIASPNHLTSN